MRDATFSAPVACVVLACAIALTQAYSNIEEHGGSNGYPVHNGCDCPTPDVFVRFPPTLTPNFDTNASWQAPPDGWFYGNWKLPLSSNPEYKPLWNLEFDSSPVFPQPANGDQVNNDLVSWNAPCPWDKKIYPDLSYDTEREPGSIVFDTQGAGAYTNVTNTWEMLAWGYDTEGVAYMLLYETAVVAVEAPPDLDILSRQWGHPTNTTISALLDALRQFGDTNLTALAGQVAKLPHDSRRDGLPPYSCDAACVGNANLVEAQATLARQVKKCL